MTKQEIKKLQEKELERWNSFCGEYAIDKDSEWTMRKRFYWCGIYEALEELGIEPIRDSRRLQMQ